MAKELKRLIVDELKERYKDIDRCVVVDLTGLSAEATVEVRNTLREHDITLSVVKNSLMTQALRQVGLEDLVPVFDGPCAVATGAEDIVELAKILNETSQKLRSVALKGGYGEGQVLQPRDVRRFAVIPPREVLLGQFLGAASAPVSGFVRTMSGIVRDFVGVLDAVARSRDEDA